MRKEKAIIKVNNIFGIPFRLAQQEGGFLERVYSLKAEAAKDLGVGGVG